MDDCIFCKIIKGELPSYKIYENDKVLAFLDISGDYYGHTLVIPKNHCENVLDCSNEDLVEVIKAVKLISNHFVDNLHFTGVNIMNANGATAEQSIFHLHFHIIPRKNNDGLHTYPDHDDQNFDLERIAKQLKLD